MPFEVGKVFANKYRIERMLGRGGMGVVVAATHLELDEPRAIKFVLPDVEERQRSIRRFLQEARSAAKLKSQHVATVYDVGRLDGAPYMVMEFLDGLALSALLRRVERLPVGEACAVMLQAMEAIDEAHCHGIVHRDLKPGNLFLARGLKDRPIVKVLDFGISKLIRPSAAIEMTATNTMLGSPHYMSPEQMMAVRNVDARSDIWSLGVILFKLITGRVPFKCTSLTRLSAMVVWHEAPRPSRYQPDIDHELEQIIMRCLAKKPRDRFADVQELMAALAPFASQLPELPPATQTAEACSNEEDDAADTDSGVLPLGSGRRRSVRPGQLTARATPVAISDSDAAAVSESSGPATQRDLSGPHSTGSSDEVLSVGAASDVSLSTEISIETSASWGASRSRSLSPTHPRRRAWTLGASLLLLAGVAALAIGRANTNSPQSAWDNGATAHDAAAPTSFADDPAPSATAVTTAEALGNAAETGGNAAKPGAVVGVSPPASPPTALAPSSSTQSPEPVAMQTPQPVARPTEPEPVPAQEVPQPHPSEEPDPFD